MLLLTQPTRYSELLTSKMVMPMHYGTFPPLKETPVQFKQALANFPTKVIVMEPGETRSFGQ